MVSGLYYWRVISQDTSLDQNTSAVFTVNIGDAPVASFTGTPTSGYGALTVNFTDGSTNTPTSWEWDFGDGDTSNSQNPQHIYDAVSAPTTFTVRLIASSPFGVSTSTRTNYISVTEPAPGASFTGTPLNGYGPLTVNFTDNSSGTPTSWAWTFGDGGTSNVADPQHIYATVAAPTTYTVRLIVSNIFGTTTSTRTNYISVTEPSPVADFDGTPLSGYGPLTVNFTDSSLNTPTSWAWTFGDGGTSTQRNPQRIYAAVSAPTTYTVRLIVTNAYGVSTLTQTNYISVTEPAPVASFSGTPLSGYGPLTVNFTDSSLNTPTSWAWDFGDGGTSTQMNPQRIYALVSEATTYTVRLIASSPFGVSTSIMTSYISVTEPAPIASFTGTPLNGYGPLTVNFTDNSQNPVTSWAWDFGDGGTSTLKNPQRIYAAVSAPTTYTIRLIASSPFGVSTSTRTNYISVTEPAPGASFTGTPLNGYGPLTVNFTDNSSGTPTSWAWTFGDGGTSNVEDPQYIYATVAAPTTYTVRLIVSNIFGTTTSTRTNYISVTEPSPVADFDGTPLSGYGPLTVNFTDSSLNTPTSWAWTFGDGGTSTQRNPQRIYAAVSTPTTYTVRLIATNAYGVSTLIQTNYISVTEPAPVASFTGNPLSGYGPLTVNFTDNSSGTPISWAWNFGDGGTSTQKNPQRIYAAVSVPTTYTVRLIATSPFGVSTSIMTNYISVTEPAPVADFDATPLSGYGPLTVNFTDSSLNTVTSWAWVFGDGGTSTQKNPQHIFTAVSAPTTYTVQLIATSPFGVSTSIQTNYISVTQPAPIAGFNANPLSGYGPLTVNFTDNSSGTPTSWVWNFGDGGTSNSEDPQHIYATVEAPTTYTVRLIVSNVFGANTSTRNIFVTEPGPDIAFSATPLSGYGPLTVDFTDESSNDVVSWVWTFGDGGTSTVKDPQHIYTTVSVPTSYTVRLIVSNQYSSSTLSKTNYISVTGFAPTADFSASPNPTVAPATIQFTDQSINSPTAWNWNFGDGGTSNSQNPSHAYSIVTVTTNYNVRLIASNTFGASTHYQTIKLLPQLDMVYSSFLGGWVDNQAYGIAVDSAGNAFVTGYMNSSNFPTTSGALNTNRTFLRFDYDIFVTKFNPAGTALIYSALIGSSNTDDAFDIAVDTSGNAYVTGYTNSTLFPVTLNAYNRNPRSGNEAFILKVNSVGTSLLYSSFLSASGDDRGTGIAVNNSGVAYVTGWTSSSTSLTYPYPTTPGAYKTSYGGGQSDAFITVINTNLSGAASMLYSSFLGGAGNDYSNAIAIDTMGKAYIAGYTLSSNFPVSLNAIDTTSNGSDEVFVSKFDTASSGSASFLYSTYLGGSGSDRANAIAVDAASNVYVAGFTESNNYPVTANAFSNVKKGTRDIFVSRINPAISGGAGLLFSSYLGGSGDDEAKAIALDSSAIVYLAGFSSSADFPVTRGCYSNHYNGNNEVVIAKIDTSLSNSSALIYATYLGGASNDQAQALAVDQKGRAYVTGYTNSSGYPVTPWAFDTTFTFSLINDVFVTKMLLEASIPPEPHFYANPTAGYGPLSVDFVDQSLYKPLSWSWNFGDGSTDTSKNPIHEYAVVSAPTSYSVQLIVSNVYGENTAIYTNYITVSEPAPVANFSGTPLNGFGPLTVNFSDESINVPTSWEWDFGDGNSSSSQNPMHVYSAVAAPTTYTVRLIASSSFGVSTSIKTNYISVSQAAPVAGFTAAPLSGYGPLTVNFVDNSQNEITSWNWDFGDGDSASIQNPEHVYLAVASPTSYTVRLIVSSPFGVSTETKVQYVSVTEPSPIAKFSANPLSGYGPLVVDFTDNSENNVTSWSWDFGDGNSSNTQNPQHTYAIVAIQTTYTVTLIVTNPYGSDTITKASYIAVSEPAPIADFTANPTSGNGPLTVDFTDNSSNIVTNWSWDFGDGNTSSSQNPQHVYAAVATPTTYTVQLIASSSFGVSTVTKTNYISVTEPAPIANFSATPLSGFGPLTVDFTDNSSNIVANWAWDFGDGNTSSSQNPQHVYASVAAPTTYDVMLIASSPFGVSTSIQTNYVSVSEPAPVANFSATPLSGYGPLTVNFTDSTENTVTSWNWNFGDGNTASIQNPEHVYLTVSEPTSYTVTLIASSPFGVSTSIQTNYISVSEPAPVANFSATPLSGYGPLTVNFTDNSSNIVANWAWDFGDGNTSSSQNPQHVYASVAAPTTYDVMLIASSPFGVSTSTKTNYISVSEPAPVANFSATPLSGYGPLTVNFTDNSENTVTSWNWNFGDGNTASIQNPEHVYLTVSEPTSYTVTLIASSAFGVSTSTKTNYISVSEPAPVANFSATPLSGYGPLTVNFTDNSENTVTSWNWNFGDGNTASIQNPEHVYLTVSEPTSYTVTLIASSPFGVSTSTKTNYISVSEPAPVANFSAIPLSGYGPLTVNFTDSSENTVTSWSWNFGDGNTASIQNPQHVYASVAAPTTYNVMLIASSPFGVSTSTKTNYISVSEPAPVANFSATPLSGYGPLTVNFTDSSENTVTSWSWNFGDGNTASIQNPQHVYATVAAPTTYTVRLIASSAFGVSTSTKTNYISVSEPAPVANFSATPLSGYGPLTVNFTDNSENTVTSWNWNFGDGNTASIQNPEHVYLTVSEPTSYTVTLIASSPFGVSTSTKTNYISVSEPAPVANFSAIPLSGYGPLTVNFTDSSENTVTSWSWNFGDGNTASIQNPQHVYASVAAPTTYNVMLIASSPFGVSTSTKTNYISVSEPAPVANFSATPLSGYGPLTVNFTDSSENTVTSWSWNFGDGNTASIQNPQHVYATVAAPTTYTVRLIASSAFGVSTSTKTNYISVSEPAPVANFSATPLSGYGPLTVKFTDTTENTPTSWNWNFGDGFTSISKNPQHIYTAVATPTTYTVILITSNSYGVSTSTKTDYIAVSNHSPIAGFSATPLSGYGPLTVQFTDSTENTPTSWSWNFGDGNTSSTQNPEHIYQTVSAPTSYTVTLIASSAFGVSTSIQTNYISVSEPAPTASFNVSTSEGLGPLTVSFTDNSLNGPDNWIWSFGDGSTSNLQNPVHTYATVLQSTSYSVTLVVSNTFGTNTLTQSNLIQVFAPVQAGFYGSPTVGYGPVDVSFIDTSSNYPDYWQWDFGDGGTSTTQNPVYRYSGVTQNTTYSVRLITGNQYSSSTIMMNDYIHILAGTSSVNLPSLKLFLNEGLSNAFDLKKYLLKDQTALYDHVINFQGLSMLSSSTVSQSPYSFATTGFNIYRATGSSTTDFASNKVKYSTYKIHKLPRIGMNYGSSMDINLVKYTYSSTGFACPESYGNAAAIHVDDTTKVNVTWINSSTIRINALSSLTTGAAVIYVSASPNSPAMLSDKGLNPEAAFGADIDKETLWIYPNLLTLGAFSSLADIGNIYLKLTDDRTILPVVGFSSTVADSEGTQEHGVISFTFPSNNVSATGINGTPLLSTHPMGQSNTWYSARMRYFVSTPMNDLEAEMVIYRGIPGDHPSIDIAGNVYFGSPTTWTWLEMPLYSHSTGPVYPQFRFKGKTVPGIVYMKELQIIKAVPQLLGMPRYEVQEHYQYGAFSDIHQLSLGWVTTETWFGASRTPQLSIVNNEVQMNFDVAGELVLKGIKLTATDNIPGGIYTPGSNSGSDVGVKLDMRKVSGTFNSQDDMVYCAIYGVPVKGSFNFRDYPGQLIAAAQFGILSDGPLYAISMGRNPYHQVQFCAKSYEPGVLGMSNVDFLRDMDDPYYGDPSLFP